MPSLTMGPLKEWCHQGGGRHSTDRPRAKSTAAGPPPPRRARATISGGGCAWNIHSGGPWAARRPRVASAGRGVDVKALTSTMPASPGGSVSAYFKATAGGKRRVPIRGRPAPVDTPAQLRERNAKWKTCQLLPMSIRNRAAHCSVDPTPQPAKRRRQTSTQTGEPGEERPTSAARTMT